MNEKEITIKIPEGKRAEWINGILTLVDEPKEDNRPVTERIKTFDDACRELGEDNQLVQDWKYHVIHSPDVESYLKLRIITAALNEGWKPEFIKEENRYYPWFWLYTKEEYDNLDEEEKQRCVLRSGSLSNAFYGLVYVDASYDASVSYGYSGSRLAFRTNELAEYAGMQFIQEWADFVFIPRS